MNTFQVFGIVLVVLVGFSTFDQMIKSFPTDAADKDKGKHKHDDDDDDEHWFKHWKVCLNQSVDASAVKTANESCIAELKLDTKTKSIKEILENNCFRVCQLKKLGLVGEGNVNVSRASVSKFVDATFPADARTAITNGITNCSPIPQGSTDTECKNAKPIIKCVDHAMKLNCKKPNGAASTDAGSSGSGAAVAVVTTGTPVPRATTQRNN